MYIDNTPASTWGASLSEKLITPRGAETTRQDDIVMYTEEGYKRIYLKILFQGSSRDQVEKNISSFSLRIQKQFNLKIPNKNTIFKCLPSTMSIEETNFNTMLYGTVEFDCIEHEEEKVISTTDQLSSTFTVGGNTISPATLELIPKTDLINITVTGLSQHPITIKNLKANKTFRVNTETGEVTLDGVNHYKDYDAWEFPTVKSGNNTVTIDKTLVSMRIKYKAIWN